MDKKVVIITGAAKGIGRAIAERMVHDNYFAILVDVDNENGTALAKELGNSAKFISCDISKHKEVENLFKSVVTEFGGVDAIVNNAAVSYTHLTLPTIYSV